MNIRAAVVTAGILIPALIAGIGSVAAGQAAPPAAEHGAAPAPANTPDPALPGKAIYEASCAACHANPAGTRAAAFSQITGMSPADLRQVLTQGVMKPMAAGLSPEQLTQLIDYLTSGQQKVSATWTEGLMCAPGDRVVNTSAPVAFGGFGVDPHSTRSLSAAQAGLSKAGLARLDVAWAVAFPQTQSLGTGVAVMGDTAFVAAAGKLIAFDANKGCARWVQPIQSRNTPTLADMGGKKVILLSAGRSDLTMVDAATGAQIWKVDAKPKGEPGIGIRGGVVVYKDKIIVPYSASGVGTAQNPKFECCVGHGAVVALNLRDGSRLWEYHTMQDAAYTGQVSTAGVKQKGPSGAPIWALPTIDEARNRVIVATGENTSYPATGTSDALIALDLDTGKAAWVFQAMASDVWNMACNDKTLGASGPNCARLFDPTGQGPGRDYDFGATPVLIRHVAGRDIVVNGQKSGHVWAVDAATGKMIWTQRVGFGSALGGVHWGVATDGRQVFAAVADSLPSPDRPDVHKPGIWAFDLKTGKPTWAYQSTADCAGDRGKLVAACDTKHGFSSAPLVVDGQVVSGTLDGKLFVLDGKTGAVVKAIDLVGPHATINGVPGRGGSIDAHAVSAGAGAIFVTSGYGAFGQTAGNVLYALKPSPQPAAKPKA